MPRPVDGNGLVVTRKLRDDGVEIVEGVERGV